MDLSKLTNDQLQTYYENAYCTYYRCIGHKKAQANWNATLDYEDEARKRGIDLNYDPSAGMGQYNGEGSF